ncbi:MAG TPA: NADH-quinone oxidoreductase subunit N [Gemmatimonadaceae bacterium]|nr:NADH-quinone oxidoreductase subunit N [Gemmatimonadaceae bacterium]
MQFDLSIPLQLSAALTPDIIMMVGAMILMLRAAWGPDSIDRQRSIGAWGIGVCVISAATIVYFMMKGASAGPGVIAVDNFRWVIDLVLLLGTAGTIALSMDYNERELITAGETHVLTLFATSGMMILAASRDLMLVFLGIELMSIAIYVLVGINRRSAKGAEGALKYFLLGSFSTAFLLYGIALVYGATASTNLQIIASRIAEQSLMTNPMLLIGLAFMLIGFGFKVAAVPFHMWAPDVYEGAPTPITAYMAAAVKAAAFAAFLRVWFEAFPYVFVQWHGALWWLAALTMVFGNIVALAQKNIKRMLAYSSIAHAGYLLVALTVGRSLGSSSFLFYVVAYTLATLGAFGIVVALSSVGEAHLDVDDYAGLWTTRPWLSVAMAVFMLALLGFPIFGGVGFFAKWYIIQAALQGPAPQARLAILLVVTSVVSTGYYLRVVMVMFMKPRPDNAPTIARVGSLTNWVIGAAAVLILALGVYPNPLVRMTQSKSAIIPGVSPFDAPPPSFKPRNPMYPGTMRPGRIPTGAMQRRVMPVRMPPQH